MEGMAMDRVPMNPSNDPEIKKKRFSGRKKTGLVIVYTGNGKGKTSAAMGMLMRAWGRHKKLAIIQFIKNGGFKSGEILAAERMGIEVIRAGDGWTWTSKDMDKTIACGQNGWEIAKQMILCGDHDIILLDEFTYPLQYGWLDVEEVIDWLKANKPELMHLVITGRNAPRELIEYANLVTEMVEIKHPFSEEGLPSQEGVDY